MQHPPKKRLTIFHKVSNLLRMSILFSKMRKPIIPKLIFLKKTTSLKRFMLLHKCNSYGFLNKDYYYEFSPSTTGLYKKQFKSGNYRDNLPSMFFLCRCLDPTKAEGGEVVDCALPLPGDDEEESVDQRAERFIEWFHQEMRMQRQESI